MKREIIKCDCCNKIIYDSDMSSGLIYAPFSGPVLQHHNLYYFCNGKCLKEWVNKEEDEI